MSSDDLGDVPFEALFNGLDFDLDTFRAVFAGIEIDTEEIFRVVFEYSKSLIPDTMTDAEAKLIAAATFHLLSTIGLIAAGHREKRGA